MFVLFVAGIVMIVTAKYTNKEAQDCYENIAPRLCSREMKDCLEDQDCQN